MFEMCPYCSTDTAGNHQEGCPNNPVKTIGWESNQAFCDLKPYTEGEMPTETLNYVVVAIEEYKRLKEFEKETERPKAQNKLILEAYEYISRQFADSQAKVNMLVGILESIHFLSVIEKAGGGK